MKPKINPLWGWITLALVILTLALCVLGANRGTLLVKTDSRPRETVETFFDAIVSGRYQQAYDCLENYSSLGLENGGDNLKWNAVLSNYQYWLLDRPQVTGSTAVQVARLRFLDVNELEKALATPQSSGENGEVSYPRLEVLLATPENYYRTVELHVTLHYAEGRWRIYADDALLSALAGGK